MYKRELSFYPGPTYWFVDSFDALEWPIFSLPGYVCRMTSLRSLYTYLHALENPRDPDYRRAAFSRIFLNEILGRIPNHHKCSFYIAIDQTGRYQLPSSFNSLHIMHPTRVLQIQPTRLLLRPVPVSYAISDTLRGGSWHFIERGAQRYELLLSPSIKKKHYKTLSKADPASTKHIQYHSVYVGWRKSPPS